MSCRPLPFLVFTVILLPQAARAQAGGLVDVCTGLSVDLPVLQPVAGVASGLLAGLLDPVLNGIVGDINVNLRDTLSGQNIGLSIRDQNGNLVTLPGNCNLKADSVTVDSPGGIAIGGGEISGLGSSASPKATASDPDAIAFGNGAATSAAASAGVAIGLRSAVNAADGVALGRDSTVSAAGGVALGAGSLALRAGLSGASEAFSGVAVASTQGALSVGSAGNERQITNVAGGTQDTDAVNLRQLRSVADNLSSALGGGAGFDTAGSFTGPNYALRSGIYTTVGAALTALDQQNGVIAGNNTSALPLASATGSDAMAAGYGARAEGSLSTAIGTQARASGSESTAIGAGAVASRPRQIAIGTAASTYTLPGLSSAASRSTQSGPTQIVTTDAAGNLAAMPIDLAGLDQRIDGLAVYARDSRREARQGVAAAMAMTGAPLPSRPGKTSWAGNTATFRGEWAAGFAVAHRLDVAIPIAINAGVSLTGNSFGGARLGLSGEF
ncbi:MAG: hypothetical protein ACTHP8_03380 [Bosea sp. (in: a-proteobacteria)]|uniref:hypothetical protein n=1 Tax=Bosea sp. (in: a-proteobacteria) TaxID=1871050 RepID=UPI003F7CAE20